MTDTSAEQPFVWKGKSLDTIGELLDAVAACESREEAERFMAEYRAVSPHADVNIGYIAGYCSPEECKQILDWTGTGLGRQRALRQFTEAIDQARG